MSTGIEAPKKISLRALFRIVKLYEALGTKGNPSASGRLDWFASRVRSHTGHTINSFAGVVDKLDPEARRQLETRRVDDVDRYKSELEGASTVESAGDDLATVRRVWASAVVRQHAIHIDDPETADAFLTVAAHLLSARETQPDDPYAGDFAVAPSTPDHPYSDDVGPGEAHAAAQTFASSLSGGIGRF